MGGLGLLQKAGKGSYRPKSQSPKPSKGHQHTLDILRNSLVFGFGCEARLVQLWPSPGRTKALRFGVVWSTKVRKVDSVDFRLSGFGCRTR